MIRTFKDKVLQHFDKLEYIPANTGVELKSFRGDWLKEMKNPDYYETVVFNIGGFRIESTNKSLYSYLQNLVQRDKPLVEVIGNIFENPELLTRTS